MPQAQRIITLINISLAKLKGCGKYSYTTMMLLAKYQSKHYCTGIPPKHLPQIQIFYSLLKATFVHQMMTMIMGKKITLGGNEWSNSFKKQVKKISKSQAPPTPLKPSTTPNHSKKQSLRPPQTT
jgi:hypothetical protein